MPRGFSLYSVRSATSRTGAAPAALTGAGAGKVRPMRMAEAPRVVIRIKAPLRSSRSLVKLRAPRGLRWSLLGFERLHSHLKGHGGQVGSLRPARAQRLELRERLALSGGVAQGLAG